MDFFERFWQSENPAVKDAVRTGRLQAFFERLLETGDPVAAADELPLAAGLYYLDKDFLVAVERAVAAFFAPQIAHSLMRQARDGNVHAIKIAFDYINQFKNFGLFDDGDGAYGLAPEAPPIVVVAPDTSDATPESGV